MGQTMFKYAGAKDWNSLPIYIREITSINIFKQTFFTYLFNNDVNSHVCSLFSAVFSRFKVFTSQMLTAWCSKVFSVRFNDLTPFLLVVLDLFNFGACHLSSLTKIFGNYFNTRTTLQNCMKYIFHKQRSA